MTETEKIDRIAEVVKYNRNMIKQMRRSVVRWAESMEDEIKQQYDDIQQLKKILLIISKKIDLKVAIVDETEELIEMDEPAEILYIPTSEEDLTKLKSKLDRNGASYFS